MAVVQVSDVPDEVVARLEARAAARGLDLGTFLRGELERLAAASANPEVVARL